MRCFISVLIGLGLLVGCATIPEEQCAQVDWYDLGIKDGLAGYGEDRLARHREACAGVKVVPDEKRYMAGRQVGLAEYCRPENAVTEGLAGRYYKDVCNEAFKRLHKAAFEVQSLKRRIKTNLDEVSNKEAELRKKETSDSRRSQLRSDIRELDRKRESLRDDLYNAERDLERLRRTSAGKW